MLNLFGYYTHPEQLVGHAYLKEALAFIEEPASWKDDKTPSKEQLAPILNIIKNDGHLAYNYAITVIKGRFLEGEAAIIKDATHIVSYATEILAKDPEWPYPNGRWPEAESTILKHPYMIITYIMNVRKTQWLEAEDFIAQDAVASYEYAKKILKHRFEKGESIIINDPTDPKHRTNCLSVQYAEEILAKDPKWPHKSGRWPEAEPSILKFARDSYEYANKILANDPDWTKEKGHENGRWPEAEVVLLKDKDSTWAKAYAQKVLKHRWPELEPKLKKEGGMPWIMYANQFNIEV